MSEWYTITDKDDVDISDDGQNADILFNTNDFGNQYVQVPIDIIANVLPHRKELETLREKVDWYWQCLDLANYFFDFLDEEDFDGDQPQHLYEIEVSCQIAEAELRSAVDGV